MGKTPTVIRWGRAVIESGGVGVAAVLGTTCPPLSSPPFIRERDMEEEKTDLEAFQEICATLAATKEVDRPRILAAVAMLHGIRELPTVVFETSRPR